MKLTIKFFYFIVLIIGCLVAMHTKLRPFPYVLLIFLIVAPLLSILFLFIQKQAIKTQAKVLSPFVKQNSVLTQQFTLHNSAKLWPTTIHYQTKQTLQPKEKLLYEQSLNTQHVGPVLNKPVTIKVFDTLDILSINKTLYPISKSFVLPEIKDIFLENLPVSNLVDFLKQIIVSTSLDQLEGVRMYQKGDSLKRMHWPISSKSNTFYSRVDESSPKPMIHCVILPTSIDKTSENALSQRDNFMHMCASIMDQLLHQSLELIFQQKSINHFAVACELLAQIPVKHTLTIPAITQPTLLFKQRLTPTDLVQIESYHRQVVVIVYEELDKQTQAQANTSPVTIVRPKL